MKRVSLQKFVILMVLFFGYMGFALVFIIFPPLFMDTNLGFVPASYSHSLRTILVGVAFSMYPMGQFLGSPLLGKMSDRYGRKPVVVLSSFVIAPGYFFSALAIHLKSVFFLCLARFVTGLLGGNIVTAYAAMADISLNKEEKRQNFGWLTSFASTAFMIGPILGGVLSDKSILPWFGPRIPFLFASLLSLVCAFFILFVFQETNHLRSADKPFFADVFYSLKRPLKCSNLRYIFSANFLSYLALFFYFNYVPVLYVNLFQFGPLRLAQFQSYMNLFIALAPFTLRFYSPRFRTRHFLFLALGGFVLSQSLLLLFPWAYWWILVPLGYFVALLMSFASVFVSNVSSDNIQGETLGFNQSALVGAEFTTSLLGGFIASVSIYLPFIVGSVMAVGAFLLYLFKTKEQVMDR